MGELLQKQQRFSRCLAKLIDFVYSHSDWELTMGDGNVDAFRKVRFNGKEMALRDLNHLTTGSHYKRLAQDVNLFISDLFITSDHPAWHDMGTYWKGLDPDARWGGDFVKKDYNHFSFIDAGVA